MSNKKQIFALLVGINDYPEPVPKLKGCESDVKEVLAYLESIEDIEVKEKLLLGKQATKSEIVSQFLAHLGQAGEQDVAFFFFAGHGTQERADEVFWPSTSDKKLQSLVCYDGVTKENGKDKFNLLANKELRYLLYKIAQKNPHILTIFDCCHSGQNTRSLADIAKRQFEDARYIKEGCPKRSWDNFIFANEVSLSSLQSATLDEQLPEGRHIQIAACLRDESAYELKGSGVFTQNLLEVLRRSESNITYYDLQSRVRNYIKNNFKQTPQIYTSGEVPNEVFRYFLNRNSGKGSPLYGRIDYKEGKGWIMDLGHIQGVSGLAEKVQVLSVSEDQQFEALITSVKADYTLLKFSGQEPARNGIYKGYVDGFLSSPIKIFIKKATDVTTPVVSMFEKALKQSTKNLNLATAEHEADYTLHLKNGIGNITFAEDDSRPLVAAINPINAEGADLVASYFNHISQWEFVKNLHNPNSYLYQKPPIKVEFYQLDESGKETLIPLKDDQILIDYNMRIGGRPSGKIKVKITNQYHKKLYFSFLYLSMNFQIFSKLLPKPVISMNVGDEIWIRDGKPIKLTYEPQVEKYNWKESISYFKLIIKESHFDAGMLDQDALPSPVIMRGGRSELKKTKNNSDDAWTTRLFSLRIKNPNFKKT